MIVADIVGALGNQLFSYAATKSIALDLGYEYRYRVVPLGPVPENPERNSDGSYFIDSAGHEYNEYFERAFHIDTTERITNIPFNVSSKWTWGRSPSTNFNRGIYNICDKTHVSGFFLCPKYFEHRRAEVLSWFRFRATYRNKAQKKLSEIKTVTGATHLVGLHFRYAKDIRIHRLAIDPEYYRNAIKEMRSLLSGEKLCFILFSDVPDLAKRLLKRENDIILHHGTMFEDLCLMTLCDSHIVSKSTFSWWGAWLSDKTRGEVIRPSIWPIPDKQQPFGPLDIYPDSWVSVLAERNRLTIRMIASDTSRKASLRVLYLIKSWVKRTLPSTAFNILKFLRRAIAKLFNKA